jgi:SAM-dependent methyltransferase
VRKVSQINHMVTLLLPALEDLAGRHDPVRILDACCGTSQLTLVLGWLFRERFGRTAHVVGVDANPAVIKTSAARATALGLEGMVRFRVADVGKAAWSDVYGAVFPGVEAGRPHLVAALHACDVATDLALGLAVGGNADVLAVAPCCHAELAAKWKGLELPDHPFAPVFHTPNLRRETAAQLTDAMRLLLVRSKGYEVTATEFVPSAHTPKNRLLLGIRRGRFQREAAAQYKALVKALGGAEITLAGLLGGEES